jgi:hypothetical protein
MDVFGHHAFDQLIQVIVRLTNGLDYNKAVLFAYITTVSSSSRAAAMIAAGIRTEALLPHFLLSHA